MADKAELEAILKALQLQGNAITQLLQQQKEPASESKCSHPSTSTQHISFDKFDPKEEDFSEYLERFKNYATLRGLALSDNVTPDQTEKIMKDKKSILLACLQRTEFTELKADSLDHKPSELTFDEVVTRLQKRYDKTINVHTERHKFLSRVQNKAESLTEYISALKLIAQRCLWYCLADECKTENTAIFQAQFI